MAATWETTTANVHRRVDGLEVSIAIPASAAAALSWVVSVPAVGADPTVSAVSGASADDAMASVDASHPLPDWWTA